MIQGLIAVLVFGFVGLIVTGIVRGSDDSDRVYNNIQKEKVLECRSAGGTARVDYHGRYQGCLLPPFVDR